MIYINSNLLHVGTLHSFGRMLQVATSLFDFVPRTFVETRPVDHEDLRTLRLTAMPAPLLQPCTLPVSRIGGTFSFSECKNHEEVDSHHAMQCTYERFLFLSHNIIFTPITITTHTATIHASPQLLAQH